MVYAITLLLVLGAGLPLSLLASPVLPATIALTEECGDAAYTGSVGTIAPVGVETAPISASMAPIDLSMSIYEGVSVQPGTQGEAVLALQQVLTAAGFYRYELDGIYAQRTRSAVVALHKALDLPRVEAWQGSDWEAIRNYPGPQLPQRDAQPDRVEIDLVRQLLYLVKGNRVIAIIPVSTGNGELYQNAMGKWVRAITPPGDYVFYRYYHGWRISYLGKLYRPWYFYGGYALHGSGQVPAEPASHGCVRVPIWDADYLAGELFIGMPLHIWRSSEDD